MGTVVEVAIALAVDVGTSVGALIAVASGVGSGIAESDRFLFDVLCGQAYDGHGRQPKAGPHRVCARICGAIVPSLEPLY